MKVAIDVSPLKNMNQYRGVGAYTDLLVKSFRLLKIPGFFFQLVEEKKFPQDCDLVHYPFFDLFFLTLPFKKEKPTIVTIHDVIPLVFPEHYPVGLRGAFKFQIQKNSLKNVRAVITDSENSKKDIFKYLNFPREKIYVVPLAPAKEFRLITNHQSLTTIKQKYNLPDIFVLYVGDVNYNKNLPGLIKALVQMKNGLSLVLVGKAFLDESLKETKAILQLISSIGGSASGGNSLKLSKEVIRLGWIPQEDLVGIYNLAAVYCQPSFYEGFGLPVLEAMACGCPVVAANTSSLPELCGKAAIMIDPDDINSIAEGIRRAIRDRARRDTLRKRGLEWVKNFNWEKVARKTYEVYQKVV